MEMKKILAVSFILLFLGVAPSINQSIATASHNDDVVEVTTQACGIQGYDDTTVTLTREQYQNLEQYLVEFRGRLNQTSTREEAIPLFKEAVMKLDTYGLLPKGMSVRQVQGIITRSAYRSYIPVSFKRIFSAHPSLDTTTSNTVCLIAGRTNNTCFRGAGSVLFNEISHRIDSRNLSIMFWLLSHWLDQLRTYNPLCLVNRGYLGYYNPYPPRILLSSGWMTTIGLQGLKKIQGDMIGALPLNKFFFSVGPFPSFQFYPAIIGFIGIKILFNTDLYILKEYFYVGSALWVSISSEPPSQEGII